MLHIRQLRLPLVAALAGIAATAPAAPPERVFADGVFRSAADPSMTVSIKSSFQYLGSDRFVLKKIANVERHHWVRTSDGRVTGMIVIQFEGLLDGVDGGYRFGIPGDNGLAGSNFRYSPAPVRLGDDDYVHNTWAFDNRRSADDNPGAESARTLEFLAAHDLTIDDELIMSRYARALGDDRRKEVILFYFEPLKENGHTLDDFPDGEPPSTTYDLLSRGVIARDSVAFKVFPSD